MGVLVAISSASRMETSTPQASRTRPYYGIGVSQFWCTNPSAGL